MMKDEELVNIKKKLSVEIESLTVRSLYPYTVHLLLAELSV